ncbi:MAG: peptidylprolyl isomerase, partial [Rhodospirillales bacterium]|nr:peptidylprolyl isomerase [Rhodospirillales bacterium]
MRLNSVRVIVSAGFAAGLWATGFLNVAGQAVADDDPVVATVNGAEIRASEVMRAESRLPARLRASPPSVTLPALISLIIDQRVMADEARKQGLADSPEVQEQLRFVEDMVLEQVLLQRHLESRLTDAKIKERYNMIVADMKARDQVRARHILVESEEDAKELISELRKGA